MLSLLHHIVQTVGLQATTIAAQNSLIISNRKNGASVDDKDAEDRESDWFARKPTQKHV